MSNIINSTHFGISDSLWVGILLSSLVILTIGIVIALSILRNISKHYNKLDSRDNLNISVLPAVTLVVLNDSTFWGLFIGNIFMICYLVLIIKYILNFSEELPEPEPVVETVIVEEKVESSTEPTDHSFAKKVADEITRIEYNLSLMDQSIRGFKQLSSSAKKLQQTLNSIDYEIEDLLNKPYNFGMNLQANIVPSDELESGEMIITRVIKPQINYKGKMIQAAQVIVSQG